LARLRNRRFFSLAELNVAIRTLVDELSGRRRMNQNPVTKARQRRRWAPQVREKFCVTSNAGPHGDA
jgi:hypothetical protein